jgi:hypothetical protein
MNYYKSVLSGNQTRLNFEDEDSFKEKSKKCINISRKIWWIGKHLVSLLK